MAAIAISSHEHTPSFAKDIHPTMEQQIAPIDYTPNPNFVFPLQAASSPGMTPARRPMSLSLDPNSSPKMHSSQRKSVSALPTFTFNASNTSGLSAESVSTSAGQISPTTPSRAMRHRRGASEFVGGNSRFGPPSLVSTSPIKGFDASPIHAPRTLSTGSPAKRHGHAHRRSAALSANDISKVIPQGDANFPYVTDNDLVGNADTPKSMGASYSAQSVRDYEGAHSRPRVGFSDNVTIIPRPLSTISSESDSSTITPAGHSVTNSITSMLSYGTTSPSPARFGRSSHSFVATADDDLTQLPRSSPEMSKGLDKEGHWLKDDPERPVSASPPSTHKETMEITPPTNRKIHFSGLDRRQSEPSLFSGVPEMVKKSSVSLQEPAESIKQEPGKEQEPILERKSSVKRVKAWASSMIHRKDMSTNRAKSMDLSSLQIAQPPAMADNISSITPSPEAEPNFEDVFTQDLFDELNQPRERGEMTVQGITSPRFEFIPATSYQSSARTFRDTEDSSAIIDLDAALEPSDNLSSSWDGRGSSFGGRRPLHSSRIQRDFMGAPLSGYHQRALSAPVLAPFEYGGRSSSPNQSPMADVFEEDEEDEEFVTPLQDNKEFHTGMQIQGDECSVGIQVVDMAPEHEAPSPAWTADDGLGINRELEMTTGSLQVSTPPISRRPSSIIEPIIVENSSPIEIVEDHEEPRASSLTKSSDSSETPTVLADRSGMTISLPLRQPSLMTPTTYAASTFSSPDFARHQGSFDTSRLGTSASSIADNRTMSSFATGEPGHEMRMSSDDVPSLTSSRSTTVSYMHQPGGRRDFSDRSASTASSTQQTPPAKAIAERRRKRSSLQSLSKLVGGPFMESKNRLPVEHKPQTSSALAPPREMKKKKEHRLSRLMFWKHKQPERNPSASN